MLPHLEWRHPFLCNSVQISFVPQSQPERSQQACREGPEPQVVLIEIQAMFEDLLFPQLVLCAVWHLQASSTSQCVLSSVRAFSTFTPSVTLRMKHLSSEVLWCYLEAQ